MIGTALRNAGLGVIEAMDGASAIDKARALVPDLILLDLMLPGMSGFDVCRVLKSEKNTAHIPVVFVTARIDEIDRVVGLELGAEDYVIKPFSPRELLLRTQMVLRRRQSAPEALLSDGVMTLDPTRCCAEIKGKTIKLTATEFRLLALLMQNGERAKNREQLLVELWGSVSEVDVRTIDVHIQRLRKKLGRAGNRIECVRGYGYRLTTEPILHK